MQNYFFNVLIYSWWISVIKSKVFMGNVIRYYILNGLINNRTCSFMSRFANRISLKEIHLLLVQFDQHNPCDNVRFPIHKEEDNVF